MARSRCARWPRGGIYDQLGGGSHRYSVDALARAALREDALRQRAARAGLPGGHQVTRKADYATGREERHSTGSCVKWPGRRGRPYYSTQDADSEGVEGKFYVWTPAEVREALGDELGAEAIERFGMTEQGNFEGANIPGPRDAATRRTATSCASGSTRRARRRVWPGLDDKRLTSWNALMVSALADAAAAFDDDVYREAAVTCADFLVTRMRDDDGPAAAHLQPRPGAAAARCSRTTRSCSRRCSRSTRRRSTRAGSTRRGRSPTRSSSASPTPRTAASSRPPTTTAG